MQYRSWINSLMYLATCTRPDISFAFGVLARLVHDLALSRLYLVRKILLYVAGTVNYGLTYPCSVRTTARSIRAHCDANSGGCKENRKSTSDWIIFIHGTIVVWRTKKQTLIANFGEEGEYIRMFNCVKQLSCMRKLLWEIANKKHGRRRREDLRQPNFYWQ